MKQPQTTNTCPRIQKTRAKRAKKWVITKHHHTWWLIRPTGLAQPCVTWKTALTIATTSIDWHHHESAA